MLYIFWRSLPSILALILCCDPIRPASAADGSPSLDLSSWLWTADALTSLIPPNATIALRRTIVAPQGKTLKSADIVMTADNDFGLYVGGNLIGSTPQVSNANAWQSAKRFVVGLTGNSCLFAIRALNYPADGTTDGPGDAGLIAVITVTYSDGTNVTIRTDTSWKLNQTVDTGFELASTDDSGWIAATSLGLYGISPWFDLVEIPVLSDATTTSLSASPTSSSTASSTAAATSTPSSSSTQSTPVSDTSAKSKSKTPAIAGGVVGGVLFIAFLLLGFLIMRRRRASDRSRNAEGFHDGDNPTAQVVPDSSSHYQTRPSISGASSSQIAPFRHQQRSPSLSAIPFLQTSSSSNLSSNPRGDFEQGNSTTTRASGKGGTLTSIPPLAPPTAPYAHREPQSAESIADLRERIQALEQVMSGPVMEAQTPMMNQYAPSDDDDGSSVPPPYAESPAQHQRRISGGSRSALQVHGGEQH